MQHIFINLEKTIPRIMLPTRLTNMLNAKFVEEPNHKAVRCWYRYYFAHNEEDVPPALGNWYVDPETTAHMTNKSCIVNSISSYDGKDKIYVGDGSSLDISRTGSVSSSSHLYNLHLSNVLVVLKLKGMYCQ